MRLVGLVVGLMLVAACSSGSERPAETPTARTATPIYPGEAWAEATAGDFAALDRDLAAARSTCFAVIKDGQLVHDAYWGGTGDRTTRAAYSITKSVTSMLVGMAADDGLLTLDDPAANYIPEWRGTSSKNLTIRDLLSNTSGRHWDYITDYVQMVRLATDKTAFAVGLAQDTPPGTVWDYNNSAVQTLEAVLQKATGEDVAAYAKKRLFDPIGLRDTSWAHDKAGNTTTYSGIDSSCHDLARLGYLMMRGGEWDGTQLISTQFVTEAHGQVIVGTQRRLRTALVGQQAGPRRHDQPRGGLPERRSALRRAACTGRARRHVLGAGLWQRVRRGDPVGGRRRRTHGIAPRLAQPADLRVLHERDAQGAELVGLRPSRYTS